MNARSAHRAPRPMVAVLGVAAALLAAGACSSKAPPAPAVITATTAGAGVAATCPATEAEVVVATGPIAVGTSVADAAAAGTLVRLSIPGKYRPTNAVVPGVEPVVFEGTVVVPLPAQSVVLSGTVAPAGGAPVVLAPPTSCWTGPDLPATVLVATEAIPAGTTLGDAIESMSIVSAEIPSALRPADSILETGQGMLGPKVDQPSIAAVVDLPPNTIVTSTTFA